MNEVTYSPDVVPPGMAAKITGISRQAIYKRMKKGTLTIHNVWGERWIDYTEITNKATQPVAATASDPSEESMKKTCGNCIYYCPDGKCCSFTFEEKPETEPACSEWKFEEL